MREVKVGQLYKAKKTIELSTVTVGKDEICIVEKNKRTQALVIVTSIKQYVCDVNSIIFKTHFEAI